MDRQCVIVYPSTVLYLNIFPQLEGGGDCQQGLDGEASTTPLCTAYKGVPVLALMSTAPCFFPLDLFTPEEARRAEASLRWARPSPGLIGKTQSLTGLERQPPVQEFE